MATKQRNPVDQIIELLKEGKEIGDLSVDETETFTVDSNETVIRNRVTNQGTVNNAGRLQSTTENPYHTTPPIIESIYEANPQTRVNRSETAFYVYSPTDATVERISADGVAANSEEEVRVLIWSLEGPQESKRYRQNVLDYLARYMDDNKQQTGLNNIEPVAQADLRNEALPRGSSHFVCGVTVSTDNYLTFD